MKTKEIIILSLVITLLSLGRFLDADTMARTLEKEFIRIVNNASPSIVEITSTKRERPSNLREKVGSGVIFDKRGYIVTTESVVGNSSKIKVTLSDGKDFEAKLTGTDPATNIAVIKINADNLPVIAMGNSDNVRSGSWVLTIGNSYGKSPTISFGIVNGVESMPDNSYYDAIRINASIRPGNSGGGVIDMDGKLVGIIAAVSAEPRIIDFTPLEGMIKEKLPPGEVFSMQAPFQGSFFRESGEAFAMPINFVNGIVNDLIESGKVERGWLGVLIQHISDEDIKRLGLDTDDGAIVVKVMNYAPASRVGIQKDDVIINFNGKRIRNPEDLIRMVAIIKPGSKVSITIIRDKQSQAMSIEVDKMPKNL